MTVLARIAPHRVSQRGGDALRVLVVDDDPLTRLVVRRALEFAGHDLSELSSGFGFTLALRDFRPDVVLLDVNMPGLGGVGALRCARELLDMGQHRPRILLHSGAHSEELRALVVEYGASGFVRKPARLRELVHAVESTE